MTLQARLLATVLSIVSLLLVVVAVTTSTVLGGILNRQLDDDVEATAQRATVVITSAIRMGATDATEVLQELHGQADLLLVMRTASTSASGVTRVADTGAFVAAGDRSPSTMPAAAVAAVQQAVPQLTLLPSTGSYTVTDLSIPEVGEYRITLTPVANGEVVVGLPLSQVQRPLHQLILAIVAITLTGLLLLAIVTVMVIRSGLRPLRRVVSTAEQIAALKLDEGPVSIVNRVTPDAADSHSEVGRVGIAMNTMLDHVDASFQARVRNEELMRRFVADASHELRTPLASIRGYSELSLRSPDNPDTTTSSLERIHAQSLRMTSLVEDLLLLARLDEGQEISFAEVDLTPLLVDAVADQRVAGPDHSWQLEVAGDSVLVHGDSGRLQQVLTNLLANARTHTPAGTRITAALTAADGCATITIRDDGPGIDEQVRATLFERFTRGDRSRARRTGGTGLGLSIVKAITEAHHGTIEVRSEPGCTEFAISLPLAIAGTATRPPAASAGTP